MRVVPSRSSSRVQMPLSAIAQPWIRIWGSRERSGVIRRLVERDAEKFAGLFVQSRRRLVAFLRRADAALKHPPAGPQCAPDGRCTLPEPDGRFPACCCVCSYRPEYTRSRAAVNLHSAMRRSLYRFGSARFGGAVRPLSWSSLLRRLFFENSRLRCMPCAVFLQAENSSPSFSGDPLAAFAFPSRPKSAIVRPVPARCCSSLCRSFSFNRQSALLNGQLFNSSAAFSKLRTLVRRVGNDDFVANQLRVGLQYIIALRAHTGGFAEEYGMRSDEAGVIGQVGMEVNRGEGTCSQ